MVGVNCLGKPFLGDLWAWAPLRCVSCVSNMVLVVLCPRFVWVRADVTGIKPFVHSSLLITCVCGVFVFFYDVSWLFGGGLFQFFVVNNMNLDHKLVVWFGGRGFVFWCEVMEEMLLYMFFWCVVFPSVRLVLLMSVVSRLWLLFGVSRAF